jgi:hypothetical protein
LLRQAQAVSSRLAVELGEQVKACLLAVAALGLAPGAHAQTRLLSPREIISVLPGRWAMEEEPNKPGGKPKIDCNSDVVVRIRIVRNENSFTYISKYENPVDPEIRSTIQANSPNNDVNQPGAIVLRYEGEERLDSKGRPIVWHLLMTDRNTFYWHREDWADGVTTPPSHRCPEPDRTS